MAYQSRGKTMQAIQPAVQNELGLWAEKRIKHLMGFEEVDDVVNYLLRLDTGEAVEEYLTSMMGNERKAVNKFIHDFIEKKQKMFPYTFNVKGKNVRVVERLPEENLTAYKKPDFDEEFVPRKKGKGGAPSSQPSTPSAARQGDKSKQPDQVDAQRGRQKARPQKQLLKDVAEDSMKLPGRNLCNCQAQRHQLLGNCLWCGKIICEQEGFGPCLFCGHKTGGDEPSGGKRRRKKKGNEAEGGSSSAAAPVPSEFDDEDLARAVERKDRLLEYERSSAQRTVVFDDQQDYFATDSTKWMSPEELKMRQDALKKKKEEQENRRTRISFDFAGRRIVASEEDFKSQQEVLLSEWQKESGALTNPSINMPRPVFHPTGPKPKSKASAKPKAPPPQSQSKRIQHEYYTVEGGIDVVEDILDEEGAAPSTAGTPATHHSSFRITGVAEWWREGSSGWSFVHRKRLLELMQRKDCNHYLILPLPSLSSSSSSRKKKGQASQPSSPPPLYLSAEREKELGELISLSKAKQVDVNVGFVLEVNDSNKQEKLKNEKEVVGLIADMVASLTEKGCRHFSIFFEPFALSPVAPASNELTVASVQSTLANSLLSEVKRRLIEAKKEKEYSAQRWYIHTRPLFNNSSKPTQKQKQQQQQQQAQQPQEHKRVLEYWRDIDRALEDKFFLLFDGFSFSAADEGIDRDEDAVFLLWMQPPGGGTRKHKLIIMDGFPENALPPATALHSATSSAAAVIPQLHAYKGRQPTLEKNVEGLLLKLDSSRLAPHSCVVPLSTAFDFMRFPYAYNSSISLTAALVDLFEDERAAEDMIQLISMAPLVSPEGKVVPFEGNAIKMKRLATEGFFTTLSSKIALAKKDCGMVAKELNEELKPFFVVLETFVEMNMLGFQMNEMMENKKIHIKQHQQQPQQGGEGGGKKQNAVSKWWEDYNNLKQRLTEVQRRLDGLLNPVYSAEVLNDTTAQLNEFYLFG